jgi:hypothetical protein
VAKWGKSGVDADFATELLSAKGIEREKGNINEMYQQQFQMGWL